MSHARGIPGHAPQNDTEIRALEGERAVFRTDHQKQYCRDCRAYHLRSAVLRCLSSSSPLVEDTLHGICETIASSTTP